MGDRSGREAAREGGKRRKEAVEVEVESAAEKSKSEPRTNQRPINFIASSSACRAPTSAS